jgi:hypothetical protein
MIARSLTAIMIAIGIELAMPAGRVIETDRSGAMWDVSPGKVLPSLVASPRDARSADVFRAQAAQLLAGSVPQLVLALQDGGRNVQGASHDRQ